MPVELDLLETANDVDAVFMALLSDHHAGAVDMTERAAEDADDRVRALAGRMADAQCFEIREMLAAADPAALDRTPAGVRIDLYDPVTVIVRRAETGSHHADDHQRESR